MLIIWFQNQFVPYNLSRIINGMSGLALKSIATRVLDGTQKRTHQNAFQCR